MLLFKQARAFGVGVLLATQNPVDLDYKALSNAGTWFLGRMQTAQDVERLVQGLGSDAAVQSDLRNTLSALPKRVFLMKNVHEDAPEVFQTRWCLSYLRGPLTSAQIKTLSASRKIKEVPIQATPAQAVPATVSSRPGLPPQVQEFFLPLRGVQPAGALPLYKPAVGAIGDVVYGMGQSLRKSFIADIGEISVSWDESQPGSFDENRIEKEPITPAEFADLPAPAYKPQNYKAWERDFSNYLYRTSQIDAYRSPEFKLSSNPGESENDFRIRVSQKAREKRDQEVEALRRKYAPKITLLEDRIRRAQQRVEKEKTDVRQVGVQAAVSLGATLLGAFMGRKTFSAGNIGRASSTIRSGMRTAKERSDIAAASENLDVLQQQRADLEAELNAEMKALDANTDPMLQKIETVAQRPKKTDITVRLVALVWLPHWKTPEGTIRPAYL